jgi:hypothetical protein
MEALMEFITLSIVPVMPSIWQSLKTAMRYTAWAIAVIGVTLLAAAEVCSIIGGLIQ